MTKGKRRKTTKGRADNDEKVDEERGGNAPIVPTETETFKISGPDDPRDELLPGVPNHVAWQIIAPKLSGTDINTLSLVSRSWREAIHRGGWGYDARVRFHSTEPFAVLASEKDTCNLCLYPLNGNSAYDLPEVPSPEGTRFGCKCIPLDGKIYILGGAFRGWQNCYRGSYYESRKMFVLDLAGHKQWKQCATMQEGRHCFGAGVLDGKIYVVGGYRGGELLSKCEVYDPKVDAWSSIADLIPVRLKGRKLGVGSIGGEVFVYGGTEYIENFGRESASAYNLVKNEWRQLGHFNGGGDQNPWVHAFVAQEKFHTMTPEGINVYDMDTNSWSSLHSFRPHSRDFHELYTWAVDDEILTLFVVGHPPTPLHCLFQSRGFGKKKREIAFEAVGNWRLRFVLECLSGRTYQMCPIQL